MTLSWKLMDIGPGGNIIGTNFANDGTGVCRTDTGCCYVNTLANPVWRLLMTLSSMPPGSATMMGNFSTGGVISDGTYGAVAAPSNSQVIYIFTKTGDIFVSQNQGVTFGTTGFTPVTVTVNAAHDNSFNDRLAVDPQNPYFVIAGCPSGTFYNTSSGSGSWPQIAGVGTGTYASLIAFDPTSAVSGGLKQGIYIATYGTGIYHSTTGPSGTFTLLNSAGMPTQAMSMSVDSSGIVYVTPDGNTGSILVWNGASWTSVDTSPGIGAGSFVRCVAPDPNTPGRVLASYSTGLVSESLDHGVTWTPVTPLTLGTQFVNRITNDIPWLGTTSHPTMAGGGGAFNPAVTNLFQMGDGLSSWQTNPYILTSTSSYTNGSTGSFTFAVTSSQSVFTKPQAGDGVVFTSAANSANNAAGAVVSYTPITATTGTLVVNVTFSAGSGTHSDWTIRTTPFWTSQGTGINQLINTRVVKPPGGAMFFTCWDRCGFSVSGPNTFPANQAFIGTTPEIIAGWDVDYPYTNPTYMAAIFNFGSDTSGFSTDGGATWTKFGSIPPVIALGAQDGAIAVACNATSTPSTQNIVWISSQGFYAGNNQPYYSTDGGANWAQSTVPSAGLGAVPTSGDCGWGLSHVVGGTNVRCVAADRVSQNIFYAVNHATNCAYISTNKGVTWTTQGSAVIPINSGSIGPYPCLKTVPPLGSTNTAGWLFLSANLSATDPNCFVRSTDGGVTWTTVPNNFGTVAAYGFGASVNGLTPALLVAGISSGTRGLFLSTDSSYSVWTNVTGNFKSADQLYDVEGDKSTGMWYIATLSTGIYFGSQVVDSLISGFSVVHGRGGRHTKMINY